MLFDEIPENLQLTEYRPSIALSCEPEYSHLMPEYTAILDRFERKIVNNIQVLIEDGADPWLIQEEIEVNLNSFNEVINDPFRPVQDILLDIMYAKEFLPDEDKVEMCRDLVPLLVRGGYAHQGILLYINLALPVMESQAEGITDEDHVEIIDPAIELIEIFNMDEIQDLSDIERTSLASTIYGQIRSQRFNGEYQSAFSPIGLKYWLSIFERSIERAFKSSDGSEIYKNTIVDFKQQLDDERTFFAQHIDN